LGAACNEFVGISYSGKLDLIRPEWLGIAGDYMWQAPSLALGAIYASGLDGMFLAASYLAAGYRLFLVGTARRWGSIRSQTC